MFVDLQFYSEAILFTFQDPKKEDEIEKETKTSKLHSNIQNGTKFTNDKTFRKKIVLLSYVIP